MNNNNIETGRVGELFAQSVLERYGIRTVHVDIKGDDLWCKTPRDVFVKVQVKSASKPVLYAKHHTKPKYFFCLHNVSNYNGVVLLVALDKQFLLAKKGTEIKTRNVKLKPETFSAKAQENSIVERFDLAV